MHVNYQHTTVGLRLRTFVGCVLRDRDAGRAQFTNEHDKCDGRGQKMRETPRYHGSMPASRSSQEARFDWPRGPGRGREDALYGVVICLA